MVFSNDSESRVFLSKIRNKENEGDSVHIRCREKLQ